MLKPNRPSSFTGAGSRLVDAATGRELAGEALTAAVADVEAELAELPDGVVFARMAGDLDGVLRHLAAFESRRVVAPLDPGLDAGTLGALVTRFRPAAVLGAPDAAAPPGYVLRDGHWVRRTADAVVPHPDLAMLLPAGGQTGEAKLVRLSRAAVLSNAEATAVALGIRADDVAPTSLPLHYSFGLAVLNSHLVRGATVVLERASMLTAAFWDTVTSYAATSVAGVPHHYETLHRTGFDPARYPSLRTLTQAGGTLRPELVAAFDEAMRAMGGRMFVMYGHTEAAPRMAVVPAERLAEKVGSVGAALPGGELTIRREDGEETTHPKIVGEVIYRGPNVMLGYAESERDLAAGDVTGGVLPTGDVGYLDADGFLYLTGGRARVGTVFGNRVSLDDLEQAARAACSDVDVVAAVPADDKVVLFAEGACEDTCEEVRRRLADRMHLHTSGFDVRPIAAVPLRATGKIDYRSLRNQV